MSGSLRIAKNNENFFIKHDHVELIFDDERIIYNDPRRFGSMHVTSNYKKHKLIKNLGPEPLSKNFNAESFYAACKTSKTNIKSFLMNQKNVVGIGNIYASESLFLSSISPLRDAKDLDLNECKKLVASGKKILKKAINVGGTTLKDFYSADGSPGYFKFELNVYGRENESCNNCCENISKIVINQRATFFCKSCQN
jgi:formamidopyrimidine-DNA glycosylase